MNKDKSFIFLLKKKMVLKLFNAVQSCNNQQKEIFEETVSRNGSLYAKAVH